MESKIKRGQILKELRIQKGMKQSEVAERMGITQQAYQRYENGTSEPNADGFSFLADFYGVTTDYLLGREKAPDPMKLLVSQTDLSPEAQEALYLSLPEEARAIVLQVMRMMRENRRATAKDAPEIIETTTAGAAHDRLEDADADDAAAEKSAG